MADNPANWEEFWNSQDLFPEIFWQKNMEIFLRESDKLLGYGPESVVLDIGSGPGYLERHLAGRVAEIHGLDVAETYVNGCRELFADKPNLHFHQLGDAYTDFSFLPERRFTHLICLSVIQYYRSAEDVEALIASARRVAAPGARLLIADILLETSLVQDVRELFRTAFAEGMVLESFRFVWRARFSSYHRLRAEQGLLTFTRDQLDQLVARTGLEARLFTDRLTLNANRAHLLFEL